jgi:receptor protein-tyrosine kinase
MIVAIVICVFQPKMYRSECSLEIQGVNENFLNSRDVLPAASPVADWAAYIQTQADILREPALIDRALGQTTARKNGGRFATPPDSKTVLANLTVLPWKGSRIIRVSFDDEDPQFAATFLNSLVAAFIADNIDVRRRAALETYRSLEVQRDGYRRRLRASAAGAALSSNESRHELELEQAFYDELSRRINAALLASVVPQANIRVISEAQPAANAFKPNIPLVLGLGLTCGLLLGAMIVILREQMNPIVRRPGDAAGWLDLPELGTIPTSKLLATPPQVSPDLAATAAFAARNRACSDSFGAILTSVFCRCSKGHSQIFGVTSSLPDEGKTTVVGHIGVELARTGKRVLLIDGDTRRPALHRLFSESNSWGLSEILREENAIEDLPASTLTRKTKVPHLHLLTSGSYFENSSGLLWSDRLFRLLLKFRKDFEYILLDTPPCLECPDPRLIGRHVDQLIFVVRANYTSHHSAVAGVRQFAMDGLPVMGVVLNGYNVHAAMR